MKKINILLSTIGAVAMIGIVGCGGGSSGSSTPDPVAPVDPGPTQEQIDTTTLTSKRYNIITQMYFRGEKVCLEQLEWWQRRVNGAYMAYFESNKECNNFGKELDGIYCAVSIDQGIVPKTCVLGATSAAKMTEGDLEALRVEFEEHMLIEDSNK